MSDLVSDTVKMKEKKVTSPEVKFQKRVYEPTSKNWASLVPFSLAHQQQLVRPSPKFLISGCMAPLNAVWL